MNDSVSKLELFLSSALWELDHGDKLQSLYREEILFSKSRFNRLPLPLILSSDTKRNNSTYNHPYCRHDNHRPDGHRFCSTIDRHLELFWRKNHKSRENDLNPTWREWWEVSPQFLNVLVNSTWRTKVVKQLLFCFVEFRRLESLH